jgi:hypothetical protein
MRKLFRKFVRWVMEDQAPAITLGAEPSSERPQASFRLGVIAAANGRILEMATFKRNPHGPDWTSELFIVPEDQTLAECITTILTIKGLT